MQELIEMFENSVFSTGICITYDEITFLPLAFAQSKASAALESTAVTILRTLFFIIPVPLCQSFF